MKTLETYFILLFLLSGITLSAQDIITINEKDRDGKYLGNEEDYRNNKIVDINSVLDIQINRNNLIAEVSKSYEAYLPDQLSVKISLLAKALEKRNAVLSEINNLVNTYDYERFKTDPEAHKNYAEKLQRLAEVINEIEMIDSRIENEADKYSDPDDIYSSVYKAATIVLHDLELEFEQFASEQGVCIQFGGWLVTRERNVPIHLQGFDEIAPQEAYEVERWQFVPTAGQVDEFNKIQQLAKDNRDKSLNILKVTARMQLDALKELGSFKIEKLADKLHEETKLVKELFGENIDPVLSQALDSISSLASGIDAFIRNLDQRLDYYKTISYVNGFELMSFLDHAKNDTKFILQSDTTFKLLKKTERCKALIMDLGEISLNEAGHARDILDSISLEYKSAFNSFREYVDKKAGELLVGQELDIAALQFSDEVYKLSLADLPSSAELDLLFTGARSDGDRLALKMTVFGKGDQEPKILETREINLFRVLPHVISTVGVIFADPLANTMIEAQFQMAPSFNFIFKGLGDQKCRRKSVAYNRLLDWGVGIHLSAPDFDKDDVPEIAAGLVVSSLHDYLQGGFAFNLFTGDPFWFFGLKFPIPSFNISTSNPGIIE